MFCKLGLRGREEKVIGDAGLLVSSYDIYLLVGCEPKLKLDKVAVVHQ